MIPTWPTPTSSASDWCFSQALAYLVGLFNFLPAHSRYMRKLAIRDSPEPWTNMNPHRKCSYFPIYIYNLSETGSNNLAIRGLSPSDCDVQFVPGLDHRQDLAETRWVNNGPPSIGWGLAHRPPCTWKEALAPCHCKKTFLGRCLDIWGGSPKYGDNKC